MYIHLSQDGNSTFDTKLEIYLQVIQRKKLLAEPTLWRKLNYSPHVNSHVQNTFFLPSCIE